MSFNSTQIAIIERCKKSAMFFMRNFIRIKHPLMGSVPFNPWQYQIEAVKAFRTHRMNIFWKCRQSGISQISGQFALWYAMFSSHRNILIVSRDETAAKAFLDRNIRFPFRHLPDWMQNNWHGKDLKDNEHTMEFTNGSTIRSLTSNPDVLRSNASSLNIIDEAAFIPSMGQMWTAGRPTLIHGGSVIVISTPNGVGNWYWSTVMDAENGTNDFNLIRVNWYDMTWTTEFVDPLTNQKMKIAPTDNIRECVTEEEKNRYGKYVSPWLEMEYRNLQEQGEAWKFEQEILAQFIGSGNTVLPKGSLLRVESTVDTQFERVTGSHAYIHPVTNDKEDLDFSGNEPNEGLWIWKKPVHAQPAKMIGSKVIIPEVKPHNYVIGVDIMTGRGRDYHAIEVFDIDNMEQAAEMMIRCDTPQFKKYVDRIGRWYNSAMLVVERNNGGDVVIDDLLLNFAYPNFWRKRRISESHGKQTISFDSPGFFTSDQSKILLNKALNEFIKDSNEGTYKIYSKRLYKQLLIYVRTRTKSGKDTNKTGAEAGIGNHDDLVIATALAFIGAPDIIDLDPTDLRPSSMSALETSSYEINDQDVERFMVKNSRVAMPMVLIGDRPLELSVEEEINNFTKDLVSKKPKPVVVHKKKYF